MSLLLREAIGGTIRRARTARRRTLRDVSREARVSLGYLSEVERGRKEPSSELLAAICEALALPLSELLDEVADTMRPVPRPVPAGVGGARRFGVEPGGPDVDDALRSAVEEAFEPGATAAPEGDGAGASAAGMSATLPAPPEPEEPAAPRTVALPEPEGTPVHDDGEEVVAPVEATTPVRLVGLVTVPPVPGGGVGPGPVVRAAA
jgi:transcriptional regulator with XRE-family HTH domain